MSGEYVELDRLPTRREDAMRRLQSWYPHGGKIYLIARRKSRTGQLFIDCKRLVGVVNCSDGEHTTETAMLNIGATVAAALGRPYAHAFKGFYASPSELPMLITRELSEAICDAPERLQVEWL